MGKSAVKQEFSFEAYWDEDGELCFDVFVEEGLDFDGFEVEGTEDADYH